MAEIELKSFIVKDINDLEDAHKQFQADAKGDVVKSSIGIPYKQLWQSKFDEELPGHDKTGTSAILFFAYYRKKLPIKNTKWMKFCQSFFVSEFGEKNVLSNIYVLQSDMPFCVVLVFPLQGRVLSSKGIATDKGPDKKFTARFMDGVTATFGTFNTELTEEEKRKKEEKMKLYPLLNAQKKWVPIQPREEVDDKIQQYNAVLQEKSIQTDLSYEEITNISRRAIYYFTQGTEKSMYLNALRGNTTQEEFFQTVDEYLNRHYARMSKNDQKYVKDKIRSAVFGYYVLDVLIEDDKISDIKILAPDNIRVKIGGHRFRSNLHFEDMNDYLRFIEGVEIKNHLDLKRRPQVIFTDKDTSSQCIMRFDITSKVVNSVQFPYLHIRKIPKHKRTVGDLIGYEMLPEYVAAYLIDQVKNAPGMVFCGKGASGKTTLMSALLEFIPYDKAGVVIQESEELFSNSHPELEFQHVVMKEQTENGEGEEIGLMELTRAALVSDEDYIIIGEVKGGECLYAINACATGHQFMCSVHSSSSQSAIDKMTDYIMYASDYSKEDAEYMLKDIKVVVFMKAFKVEEISEVIGWDHETKHLKYRTIYVRNPDDYIKKLQAGILQG